MDSTELLSYILSAICVIVGVLILWGDEDYIVPASGRSLRLPWASLPVLRSIPGYSPHLIFQDINTVACLSKYVQGVHQIPNKINNQLFQCTTLLHLNTVYYHNQ